MFIKIKKLSDNNDSARQLRVQSGGIVTLGESPKSTVDILRQGTYQHAEYGEFVVDKSHFESMVQNFKNNSYGQKIFIDVSHKPEDGAAGEITDLRIEGLTLVADVEWTPYGIDAIRNKKFIYLSADYLENHIDNETHQVNGCLLRGAGLVTRPHIKNMRPVTLSECALSEKFIERLLNEAEESMKTHLKKLKAKFASLQLSESITNNLLQSFEKSAKALGDDEKQLSELAKDYEGTAQEIAKLASASEHNPMTGMTADDVRKLLAEERSKEEELAKGKEKNLAENVNEFHNLIDATSLSNETKLQLKENASIITADMSKDAVKALAEGFIKSGNTTEAARQLSAMGYHVEGNPSITIQHTGNEVKLLQETITKGLRNTSAHANSRIVLTEESKLHPFTQAVLAEYDRLNFQKLAQEQRTLSEGTTHTGNQYLPASITRNVIREALSDLRILELVQTLVDSSAQSTAEIPYEVRNSHVANDGIVYESQGIPFSGVGTATDLAYINATKLALKVTNEVMHFTSSSIINWNAWGENIAANSRIIKEIINRRLANEMLRASDSYLAKSINGEAAKVQQGIIKTAEFPVVRPRQDKDLKGNNVGNPICPVSIVFAGKNIQPYDGMDKSSEVYFTIASVNLGYIHLVDKNGVKIEESGEATISYHCPTNIKKFDQNTTKVDYKKHLNGALDMIGDQSAMLSSERFIEPEYALMSTALNNEITKADQFEKSHQRNGTNTSTLNGDLVDIKGIPSFKTNAPAIDLANERLLLGRRNATTYVIAKPWQVGQPFEAVNEKGQPTGEKVAYGEEYSGIHTPPPVSKQFTSVLIYNSKTR